MTTPPSGPPSDQNPYEPYGSSASQPYNPPPVYGQPYSPPPAYGQGYGYPMPPKTNGLAIASLVTSIVSLTLCMGLTGIVGAILGHVSRNQIKRTNEQGAGLALAGLIVGWLGFALFVGFVVLMIAIGVWADSSIDDYESDYSYG